MLATAPDQQPRLPCPVSIRDGYEYAQQLPDGRVALGGFSDLDGPASYTDREELSVPVQERLTRYLGEDLGVSAPVTHRWVGIGSYAEAELRVQPWLRREPNRFFLATKAGRRRADEAREELHRSLDRLGVDHVDLWQLHNLADPIEWDTALSPGGALEAAVQARDEGLVRFIGVTGHGAQIAANHRRSLERFDFDSVLLPYNRP